MLALGTLTAVGMAQSPGVLQLRATHFAVQRTPEGELRLEVWGAVEIEYAGRTLRGERFQLDTQARRIQADAPFTLIAAEGVLNGQRLDYFYEQQRGRFEGVQASVLGVYLDAAVLEGDLTEFLGREVVVSSCDPLRPPIRVQARQVRLREGARLTVRNARFFLYAQPLGTLPQLTVRLRETTELVSLPSPVYHRETGWGLRLRLELPLSDTLLIQASGVSYLQTLPEIRFVGGLALGRGEPIMGEPDLRLRFEQSALYNLRASPDRAAPALAPTLRLEYSSEVRPLLSERAGVRLSRREVGLLLPLQRGSGFGGAALRVGTLRERVDHQRTPAQQRVSIEADWLQPVWQTETLSLRLHLWSSHTRYQAAGDYQWLRAQAELLWQPRPSWQVLLGYARSATRGNSPFLSEQLRVRRELSLRTEYQYGNLRLGTLLKYDVEGRDLYDVQVLLGWRDRCLEPYLFWRRSPSVVQLGVNLIARPL